MTSATTLIHFHLILMGKILLINIRKIHAIKNLSWAFRRVRDVIVSLINRWHEFRPSDEHDLLLMGNHCYGNLIKSKLVYQSLMGMMIAKKRTWIFSYRKHHNFCSDLIFLGFIAFSSKSWWSRRIQSRFKHHQTPKKKSFQWIFLSQTQRVDETRNIFLLWRIFL